MRTIRLLFILLFFVTITISIGAQTEIPEDATSYRAEVLGSMATGENTPFWMVSNRYGVVPLNSNNGYGRVGVFHQQNFGKGFRWSGGLDALVAAPRYKEFYLQQVYLSLGYKCLDLTIGSKEQYESMLDGFMSTGDVLQSANARPMPEIHLSIPHFTVVPLTKGWLQVKGNVSVGRTFDNDYLSYFTKDKQVYVKNVLWHKKALYFQIKDTKGNFPLSAIIGVQHVAQWGGTSTNPAIGEQPHSFKDFIRVFVGHAGDANATISDQQNVLGSHFMAYNFLLAYEADDWRIKGYHQHLASDQSGMEFYNGMDGLWGLELELPRYPWLRKIVFEYFTTLNQSGPYHYIAFDHDAHPGRGGGGDDYYNSMEYIMGMSYFNRGVGSPLIPAPEYNTNGKLGFRSSRVKDWHVGFSGDLSSQVSYRMFCTVMSSYGTPGAPFLEKKDGVSLLLDVSYIHPKLPGWTFGASIGADLGDVLGENTTGFSLKVSKSGILKHWK